MDIAKNTSFATSIRSGSKAEGLDLNGSDFNQICLPNFIRVYESLNDVQYIPYQLKIPLIMDTNDINPALQK